MAHDSGLVKRRNKKNMTSLSASLKRVILGIILIVLISFLIAMYFVTDKERLAYTKRNADSILRTLSSRIASDIDNYKQLSRIIMTDDRLVTFLRANGDDVDIGMINDARYGVMDILYVTEGIDSVMVFREDMIMMATNRFFYKYDYDLMNQGIWKDDILAAKGKAVVSLNCNGIASRNDRKPVVTIGREINDIFSQKRTGVMLMNISSDTFVSMLHQLEYDKNICIMGTDGTYFAGNSDILAYYDDSFLSERVVNKTLSTDSGNVLVSGCKIEGLPIVILNIAPYAPESIPYTLLYILLFLMLLFLLSATFIGAFISRRVTKPVLDLSDAVDRNEQSGKLIPIDTDMRYDELDMLKNSYNKMIESVNGLIRTVIDKEKTVQRMEMRVLQEQIKPHFLYNSLETIGYLALEAGADKVHDSLETLGSFYRNFLSKGSREITLLREIQIVRDYLALQKLRYGDIIDDIYDIAEDTEEYIIPKLILQPIVENCIYHGIRIKGEKGTIRITSRLIDDVLHLAVRDTGVGMSKEQIDKILMQKRDDTKDTDKKSFGLWDTIERIRIFCGRDDVVKIESEPGEYTEIELIIYPERLYGGNEQTIQSDVNR